MGGNRPDGLKLYNFVDNHDVERIYTKLNNKAHFIPVHILMYTLPGVPSIYYGSEFGIEGKKEKFSDASLRPALNLDDYKNAVNNNVYTKLIAALGRTRQQSKALSYGDYKELKLMNRQYAFSRNYNGESVVVTVNNDDSDYVFTVPAGNVSTYIGALTGEKVSVSNGTICVNIKANSGEIWVPLTDAFTGSITVDNSTVETANKATATPKPPVETEPATHSAAEAPKPSAPEKTLEAAAPNTTNNTSKTTNADKAPSAKEVTPIDPAKELAAKACDEAFEKGKIAGLQEAILAIMEKNGPVTDQMKRDVYNNEHHDSLINWVKSFR